MKFWGPKAKGQRTSLILVASWWTILFVYFVSSRAFLLREQPFVLDWLWWVLLTLPLLPALYSWIFMRRVSITEAYCHPFHVGRHGTLQFTLGNAGRLPIPGLRIDKPQSDKMDAPVEHSAFTHLKGRDQQKLKLAVLGEERGRRPAPKLRLQTFFPFSMFITWKTFQTQGEYVVYPEPEPNAPPWPEALEHGARKVRRGEDVVGFREHRHDDPLNIVDWKASAKLGRTVAREYHDQDCILYFSWDEVAHLETEQAISRLTAWILMADGHGRTYCLDLPDGAFIAASAGEVQKHSCLAALADYKRPTP